MSLPLSPSSAWVCVYDVSSGRDYWYNKVEGKTAWSPPPGARVIARAPSTPPPTSFGSPTRALSTPAQQSAQQPIQQQVQLHVSRSGSIDMVGTNGARMGLALREALAQQLRNNGGSGGSVRAPLVEMLHTPSGEAELRSMLRSMVAERRGGAPAAAPSSSSTTTTALGERNFNAVRSALGQVLDGARSQSPQWTSPPRSSPPQPRSSSLPLVERPLSLLSSYGNPRAASTTPLHGSAEVFSLSTKWEPVEPIAGNFAGAYERERKRTEWRGSEVESMMREVLRQTKADEGRLGGFDGAGGGGSWTSLSRTPRPRARLPASYTQPQPQHTQPMQPTQPTQRTGAPRFASPSPAFDPPRRRRQQVEEESTLPGGLPASITDVVLASRRAWLANRSSGNDE